MATEEDIYIESDGKRVLFTTKTLDGTATLTIPELSVIHRALVSCRGSYIVSLASGGISGNALKLAYIDPTSGQVTSGLGVSGDLIDVVAAGA